MSKPLLATLIFLALLLPTYFAYRQYSTSMTIDSYEACAIASGSVIQTSYPAICTTRFGASFVETLQQKTHTSKELEISFAYPESWQVFAEVNSLSLQNKNTIISFSRHPISDLPKGYVNSKDWFTDLSTHKVKAITPNDGNYYGPGSGGADKWYMYYSFSDMEPITIAQQNALIDLDSSSSSVIIIPREKYVYEIRLQPVGIQNDIQVAKILTSFKFTSTPSASPTTYTCPKSEWVDCMPGPDVGARPQCEPAYLKWATDNCEGFQGGAL